MIKNWRPVGIGRNMLATCVLSRNVHPYHVGGFGSYRCYRRSDCYNFISLTWNPTGQNQNCSQHLRYNNDFLFHIVFKLLLSSCFLLGAQVPCMPSVWRHARLQTNMVESLLFKIAQRCSQCPIIFEQGERVYNVWMCLIWLPKCDWTSIPTMILYIYINIYIITYIIVWERHDLKSWLGRKRVTF